jgi:hypothetical protein
MNPAEKREFSALVAHEIGWKGYCTEVELEEFGDYVDQRSRLPGMRKLMRSALRKRDAALAVSLKIGRKHRWSATVAEANPIIRGYRWAQQFECPPGTLEPFDQIEAELYWFTPTKHTSRWIEISTQSADSVGRIVFEDQTVEM